MKRYIALLIIAIFLFGCTSNKNNEFVGKWRILSQTGYVGTGGHYSAPTELLDVRSDSTWSFESSSGTWEVKPIEDSDWKKWQTETYGPTRKMILHNWNGGEWGGPIEESSGNVDFFWVIYDVDIGNGLQQAQMKFGHST